MANAIEKLTKELAEVGNDKYVAAVKEAVFEMLCDMCNKSPELEQIVANSAKNLNDCLLEVVKDVRGSISDIGAYRRAVKYYCPDADIEFDMRIVMPGNVAGPKRSADVINIFDIL